MSTVSLRSRTVMAGFGLVDLTISLALGLVIILGVTTLFADSSRALTDITRAGRQVENSLYAMDVLAKEIALVGYWGEANSPVDADDPTYGVLRKSEVVDLETTPLPELPPLCVGTGATGFDPLVELGWAMEYPLLSGSGQSFNDRRDLGECGSAAEPVSEMSQFIAVRRASTCATGLGSIATANRCRELDDFFYLQTNGCFDENAGLSGGEVRLSRVDSASIGTKLNYLAYGCDAARLAPIYRYVSRIYYVTERDQLVRSDLDLTAAGLMAYKEEIVAEGVEDLQFEWFIDDTGDGEYDRVESILAHADVNNTVGVRIWLMVRSLASVSGHVDNNVYSVAGQDWQVPPEKTAYPRTLQSRMVSLPNVLGRRR